MDFFSTTHVQLYIYTIYAQLSYLIQKCSSTLNIDIKPIYIFFLNSMIISSLFLITLSNKNKKHFILCSQNLSIPYTYFINIEQNYI